MKRTISVMVGKGSVNHNSRKFTAQNVDKERTEDNIVYCNENIKKVYRELFGEAVERYNAKQTRNDRKIDNYYEKIRTGKQEKLFHEIILQVGNCGDMNAKAENGQLAKTVLDKYMQDFQNRNPNLRVFSVHLHMDEATPHLHIDFVPFTTGSKRGLDTRVSLKKALAAQGFEGGSRSDTEWKQWVNSEKEKLSEVMLEYGIEWAQKGTHEKHKTVDVFKKELLEKEVEKLEETISEKQATAEKMDIHLEKAQSKLSGLKEKEKYIGNAAEKFNTIEQELPEPAPLTTAKSYREKAVIPFLKKIKLAVLTLVSQNYDLRKTAEKLKDKVTDMTKTINRLMCRVDELKTENEDLKKDAGKYFQLRSYLGEENTDRIIEDIEVKTTKSKRKRRDMEL